MEKLGTMLTKRQLMLVVKEFSSKGAVSEDTTVEPINQIGNSKFYREIGTPHRWQFDFRDGVVVGVHRQVNYFVTD